MMLQRISTSAEMAVDHYANPTRVCKLILAFRQSGKPLSTHISNLTLRATMKLKKFILSAQSPMADPGLSQYSKFMGRMASSMSEKSSVRCFFRILAYLTTRFLSMRGKMLLLIIGYNLVDIILAIEFPIYILYASFFYNLLSLHSNSQPFQSLQQPQEISTVLSYLNGLQHLSYSYFTILSVIMNALTTKLVFGVKQFAQFRKKLIHDFKKGGKHDHKNTHALPLQLKQKLLNEKKGGNWKKIRELERQSLTPYGRFTKHGFVFQKDKLPFYDIPNVEGFELKPYVEYLTPLVKPQLLKHQQKANQQALQRLKYPELEQTQIQMPKK